MNVTVNDIRAIKPGETRPFLCESEKACTNAGCLVSQVQRDYREELISRGISRFSRKIDYGQKIINITAHPIQ